MHSRYLCFKITDGKSSTVLAITANGYGKRIDIDEFRTQKRGGKGVIIMKFKQKASKKGNSGDVHADALSCMRICSPGDEIVLSTSRGAIIRQRVDDISLQSRAATGVLVQKMSGGDFITMVDIVPPAAEDHSLTLA